MIIGTFASITVLPATRPDSLKDDLGINLL
jgi:hypothetical protein